MLDTEPFVADTEPIMDAKFLADRLSARERRSVELKALEQALRDAELARIEPALLLPVAHGIWPFALSESDRDFLRVQKISLV